MTVKATATLDVSVYNVCMYCKYILVWAELLFFSLSFFSFPFLVNLDILGMIYI